MKDVLIGMFTVLLLGGIASQIFPYWIIVVVGGLVGMWLNDGSFKSFMFGFLGAALLWGIMAFRLDEGNEGILSARISENFGGISPAILILITAFIGGLLGGLGAMTGTLGRKLFG